ncbi:unnamed protein product [Effrenium voratum]|nr:unnamed protein product [Effrenium voratum]
MASDTAAGAAAPAAVPTAAPAAVATAPAGQTQAVGYQAQNYMPMGQPGYGQGGYPGQAGYPGQYGQPGYGQGPGYPGQPGQQMQPQDMRPQLNFRTVVRCFMEIAAIIQGFSLILMMGSGWVQEMGSNEEQPLRRFAVWLGSSVRGAVSSVVPLAAFKRKHRSLEEIWDTQPAPSRPTRWWVVLGCAYFAASFLQEWSAYRRAKAAAPQKVAEGDAAGGRSSGNLLDFYLQKQQEMHRQKTGGARPAAAPDLAR